MAAIAPRAMPDPGSCAHEIEKLYHQMPAGVKRKALPDEAARLKCC
jgi:hypothetical protein